MCYSYTANENNPGGFKELSAKKGTSILYSISILNVTTINITNNCKEPLWWSTSHV